MNRSLARVMVVVILGSIVLSACGIKEGGTGSSAQCGRLCEEKKERESSSTDEILKDTTQEITSTIPETKQSAKDFMSLKLCAHDPVAEPEAHAASPDCI